jgi:hypothetical protein
LCILGVHVATMTVLLPALAIFLNPILILFRSIEQRPSGRSSPREHKGVESIVGYGASGLVEDVLSGFVSERKILRWERFTPGRGIGPVHALAV